jgi:hypothetical protein
MIQLELVHMNTVSLSLSRIVLTTRQAFEQGRLTDRGFPDNQELGLPQPDRLLHSACPTISFRALSTRRRQLCRRDISGERVRAQAAGG